MRSVSSDYNKAVKVDICVSLSRNRVLNLDQILGMNTGSGQLNLLNDPGNVFLNNVVEVTSGSYVGARMFNARLAYSQSLNNPDYDYNGDATRRKFEFEYVDPANQIRKTVTLVLYL